MHSRRCCVILWSPISMLRELIAYKTYSYESKIIAYVKKSTTLQTASSSVIVYVRHCRSSSGVVPAIKTSVKGKVANMSIPAVSLGNRFSLPLLKSGEVDIPYCEGRWG